MKYELIIFDADEALFDFKKSEKVALESTMRDFNVKYFIFHILMPYQGG